MFTTWRISFDHIRRDRPPQICLLGEFFDRQGIPEWILKASRLTKDATQASDREADTGDTGSDSSAGDDGESNKSDGDIDGDKLHTVGSKMMWRC